MTATVRTIEPTQITTREEVHWTRSYADYPASLWQLNYYFRGPNSATGFNAAWATEVTADGDDFDIVVPASKTDDMTVAGTYIWQAWLTEIADTTNKINVNSGYTLVKRGFDPDADEEIDTRTQNEIIYDSINVALLAFGTSDVLEYEITTPAGSRRVKRSDKTQLMTMRSTYATLVTNERARERVRNGGSFFQSVKVRMRDK